MCAVLMRCVMCAQLAVATVMRRYADERLRDSNALLRARKMFYFCYANGAVATAMRRYIYIHVNVIFLLHTPQSVACVSFCTYVCANWAIAVTTAMPRYADGAVTYDGDASLRATYA